MEAIGTRHIKDGSAYNRYFEVADGQNVLMKRGASLKDTINFLPKAIREVYKQAAKIANYLKGGTLKDTCENIWNFLYEHVQYTKDDKGKEQIRSPRRSWADRVRGVDCDDYTVFISSILTCLRIPHIMRVAMYTEDNGFQHIYPIVPVNNRQYITIDCVVDSFNYEVPFIDKIDRHMDLEFLNGVGGLGTTNTNSVDAEDLMQGLNGQVGDLGLFKNSHFVQSVKQGVTKAVNTVKTVAVKAVNVVHAVNVVNPATALLRLGILASLRLNLFNVAGQLRYAYLTTAQANAKDFDMGKFQRLQGIKDRLEKIFYGAGGKQENFKEAILKGKGNQNQEVPVSGLGYVDYNNYAEGKNLRTILGDDTYQIEYGSVNGLGDPATASALAAATTVMTAIAGLLKAIGSLRKKPDATSTNTPTTDTAIPATDDSGSGNQTIPSDYNGESLAPIDMPMDTTATSVNDGGANSTKDTPATAKPDTVMNTNDMNMDNSLMRTGDSTAKEQETFLTRAKAWVKDHPVATAGIGLGLVGLCVAGYKLLGGKKKGKALSGVPKRKGTQRKSSGKKNTTGKKKAAPKKQVKYHRLK